MKLCYVLGLSGLVVRFSLPLYHAGLSKSKGFYDSSRTGGCLFHYLKIKMCARSTWDCCTLSIPETGNGVPPPTLAALRLPVG